MMSRCVLLVSGVYGSEENVLKSERKISIFVNNDGVVIIEFKDSLWGKFNYKLILFVWRIYFVEFIVYSFIYFFIDFFIFCEVYCKNNY